MFLFSGDLGSGSDLEGNLFALIMVLTAIIADIERNIAHILATHKSNTTISNYFCAIG